MLRSLDQTAPTAPLQADVVVVGAGLAGLFLADRLAARGLHVLVLESGAETQDTDTHPLNVVELEGDRYMGAKHGRFRCLGGTSTRWGGALLPYLPEDLGPHPCSWHAGWGIRPEALSEVLPAAEAAFDVARPEADFEDLPDVDALMILHPGELSEAQLYLIDQFALTRGRVFAALGLIGAGLVLVNRTGRRRIAPEGDGRR